jgi:hypothetical protein
MLFTIKNIEKFVTQNINLHTSLQAEVSKLYTYIIHIYIYIYLYIYIYIYILSILLAPSQLKNTFH